MSEKKPRERDTAPPIPLPFEEAVRAALETQPEPESDNPFGKRGMKESDVNRSKRYDRKET